MKKKGFTLLEIIVATMIFAAVISGLTATFISTKRHLLHTKSNIQAAEIARGQLDMLNAYVRQDTWDTAANSLTAGRYPSSGNYSVAAMDNSNVSYEYNYTVRDMDINELRRVDITVTWNEP